MQDFRVWVLVISVAIGLFVLVLVWYQNATADHTIPVVGFIAAEQLRCGDLLLVSGDWDTSRLICRLTRMRFSHVAVCIRGGDSDDPLVLDAVQGRTTSPVTIQPLKTWLSEVTTWGPGALIHVRKLAVNSMSDLCFSDRASGIAGRWHFADGYAWLMFLAVCPQKQHGFCSHLIGEVVFSERGLWPGHFGTHKLRKCIKQNTMQYTDVLLKLCI